MRELILALLLTFPILVLSQGEHFKNKNAIKLSPFELGRAQFEMTYERSFNQRSSSILIIPSIYLKDDVMQKFQGIQIAGQYRIFLSHLRSDQRKLKFGLYNVSFYSGIYTQYLNYSEDYLHSWWDNELNESKSREFRKDIDAAEGGALIGMQIDLTDKILIDFYVGGGVRYSDVVDSKDDFITEDYYPTIGVFETEYKGVKPKVGFQIGFLF